MIFVVRFDSFQPNGGCRCFTWVPPPPLAPSYSHYCPPPRILDEPSRLRTRTGRTAPSTQKTTTMMRTLMTISRALVLVLVLRRLLRNAKKLLETLAATYIINNRVLHCSMKLGSLLLCISHNVSVRANVGVGLSVSVCVCVCAGVLVYWCTPESCGLC